MNRPIGVDAASASIDDGLAQLRAGFTRLSAGVEGGGLGVLDDDRFIEFMQDFEGFRRRLSWVDHAVVREGQERGLPERLAQRSMQGVLESSLRVSAGEASRRVRAAEALGERVSMLGEVLPPLRPVLAAAHAEGVVSAEQVSIIVRGLAKVDRAGFNPADIARGEQTLTEMALRFGPKDLLLCTERFVAHLDPDGTRPRDELNHDRRHVELRPRDDGSWSGELRLTAALGAKLHALLSPLAKPRTGTTIGAEGKPVELLDTRTYGQRLHDAFEEVCDRQLRAGDLPDSGGTPATVIVTMQLEDLLAKTGFGTTSGGQLISTREVLQMASEAEIVPAVLNASGAVLDLGRSRRIASRSQTLALIARDGGCSFPGCAHPPEWCERHHIREWSDGGLTDLNNLTLLCRYHHHNFAAKGWGCRLNLDGLPEWIPPKHVDRTQTAMLNNRIVGRLAQHDFTTAS